MTLFLVFAALLILVALALMLPAIIGERSDGRSEQLGANIIIARERRVQLDNALATSAIDEVTHRQEVAVLEQDLARELAAQGDTPSARPSLSMSASLTKWGTAIALFLFVPLASAWLYLNVGDPDAMSRDRTPMPARTANTATGPAQPGNGAPPLADLLPDLEARLAENPDDVMGWRLLGRSYITVNEFGRAASALKRALKLEANDVDTLAQLAEATAMDQGGELAGEPLIYLEKAFELNDSHGQTLWLLGIARQQAGEHEQSLELLGRLRDLAAADSNNDAVGAIEEMMNRSLDALGQAPLAQGEPGGSTSPESGRPADTAPDSDPADAIAADLLADADRSTEQKATSTGLTIDVSVSLSDDAAGDSQPGHAVFVYARASNGPPMPLAVARLSVSDLPTTVTLDESMAMIPNMTLSAFPQVTVGARMSKSGDPVGQSGDWFNEVEGLDLTEETSTSILIDTQKP